MKVKDLMTIDVKTCAPHTSLALAAKLMWDHDIGDVVVVDKDHHVVGIVTDRDVAMHALHCGRALSQLAVKDAMSADVWSCTPDTTVEEAEKLLAGHQVHRLPVVGEDQRLAGILSLNDLARATDTRPGVSAKDIAQTLRAVGAQRSVIAPSG